MLKKHDKFNIIDVNSRPTGMFWEVNWNPKQKETNESKVVKMTFPDGKEHFVPTKILLEILFALGKPEDQRKMIPQTLETVHHYSTTLGIKATKEIAKGEMINFPIELSVPCSSLRQEVISSLPKEYKNGVKGVKSIHPIIK